MNAPNYNNLEHGTSCESKCPPTLGEEQNGIMSGDTGDYFSTGSSVDEWAPPSDAGLSLSPSIFDGCIVSADELEALEIPRRECLAGTWLREAGSGFIFAPRGLGKTWFGLHLACGLTEGRDCGPWEIPKVRRVLYVDGEMHLDALRDRQRALSTAKDAPLFFLSHARVFEQRKTGLNLASEEEQKALTVDCISRNIEVLILDNLSCLFYGMRENDADDWEKVQPWLFELRNKGIAVIIIHHAGKNGVMRGTSKREGPATFILSLTAPSQGDEKPGAHFISTFLKNREGDPRSAHDEEGPWLWHFKAQSDERVQVTHQRMESIDRFVGLVNAGLSSCRDIAEEMGVTKGCVSKWAKKAAEMRPPLITIDGSRGYLAVE
jgi:hypothetical protein